jgi:hypothetical protein
MKGGDLDTGHAFSQEGAGSLDMRNIVCVAEPTMAWVAIKAEI